MIFQVDKAILAEFSKLHVQKTCFSVLTALEDCMVAVTTLRCSYVNGYMYLNSSDTVFALRNCVFSYLFVLY